MQGRAEKTRDKMRRGGLPAPFPADPWRRIGTGDPCRGCGDPIDRGDTQMDVDVRGALVLAFHEGCYLAWSTFSDAP
jgi:hypothetical protein